MREATLAAEIEAVRNVYAALNRGDVPGVLRLFDVGIERVEELPGGGTHRGLAAVTEHVAKARATWAEGGCEPQRVFAGAAGAAGDRVVAFVDVRVRLKDETDWREGRVVDVYTFRGGKVVEFRTFGDERRAVQWAGVQISDATDDSAGQTGAA